MEAISVYVRSRPLFASEHSDDAERNGVLQLPYIDAAASLAQGSLPSLAWELRGEDTVVDHTEHSQGRAFAFNGVLPGTSSNAQAFEACARPLVACALGGVNAALIAYGQTGSGKTHSILGTPSDPGMLPRSVQCAWELMEAARASSGASFAVCCRAAAALA
jgi:hypothetical protein